MRVRWSRWLLGVMVLSVLWSGGALAAERRAMGLIVKLKEAQAPSVVRLRALAIPSDAPAKLAQRLSAAAQRSRVSYLMKRPTAFGAMVMHNRRPVPLLQAQAEAARMRQDPDVEWVIVNELEQPMAITTNDPYYPRQEWMSDSASGAIPNIPAAFDRLAGRTLTPVVVAVLDTGILPHPDLEGRVYRRGSATPGGYDFVSEVEFANDGSGQDDDASDPGDFILQSTIDANPALYDGCEAQASSWHGTSIAAQLAAIQGNGMGMVGMLAPLSGVPVLPVRVAGTCGAAVSDIVEGMLWSAGIGYAGSPTANPHPARVLSLSFGGDAGCSCANKANLNGADGAECLYQNVVDALTQKGALLVAAAGNGDGTIGDSQASRPASCPGVLAVTALVRSGAKASYASFTPIDSSHFAVATMGGSSTQTLVNPDGIFTVVNQGANGPQSYAAPYPDPLADYDYRAGTSFATPIAAGTVALMWAANPNLTVAQILSGLSTSGVRPHVTTGPAVCTSINRGNCRCTSATCGSGILDVDKAVQWAVGATATTTYVAPTVSASFFTPERVAPSRGSSGGGGGALDPLSLGVLGALATAARLVPRLRRRLH